MTETEAQEIARLMIDTWPTGPRAYIWARFAREFAHDLARETYSRLARENDRPPTLQRFGEMYRVVRREHEPMLLEEPDEDDTIDRREYLRRLAARAERDPVAADELERWRRMMAVQQ